MAGFRRSRPRPERDVATIRRRQSLTRRDLAARREHSDKGKNLHREATISFDGDTHGAGSGIGPAIRTRDDVRAIEALGLPADLPASSYQLLETAAARYGETPALGFFLTAQDHRRVERISYRTLFQQVTRAANLFTDLGIGPDDVVALVLPNLPETHFALWGGEAAGVAMPINPLLEPQAIAGILNAAGARVVVTLAPFPGSDLYDKTVQALDNAPAVERLLTIDLSDHVHGLKRLPARFLQARARKQAHPLRSGVASENFNRALSRRTADRLVSGRAISSDDIASIFCTGGTTGAPKLARRTHGNEMANAWMATRILQGALEPGGVFLGGLPLFHVNGAIVTGPAAFLSGAQVLISTPQGFRGPGLIDSFWDIVAHHRVAAFSGVPTLFTALLQRPVAGRDISSLRFAICGAAPMGQELIHQFETATGLSIMEGYGLTEATCVVSVNPFLGERRAGSVGLPLAFQSVLIAAEGPDGQLTAAPQGEIGRLLLRGPNVFQGYVDPAHEAGLWVDVDGERWLETGDLGLIDDDGYLWLKGRSKDLIIRGGHNIDPLMIEEAFYKHPAVALAAAVGRPDPHAGEVPVVYLTLKPGADADPDTLLAFVQPHIPERAAWPKAVVILDDIPLTAIGKVFKPTLRALEQERAASAAT